MHRVLFLLLKLLLLQTFIFAQTFTVSPNPAYGEADLDDPTTNPGDILAAAEIFNNTDSTLFFRWERIENNRPDGWETSVLGVVITLPPWVDSSEFSLSPNSSGLLNVNAWPSGSPGDINGAIPGEATVKLKITNQNDLSDTLIATYYFNLEGDPILSTSAAESELVKLYPNPASEYFKLTGIQDFESVIVYDIFGRQVDYFAVNNSQEYNIGNLPNGVYLVGLFGRSHKKMKMLCFQKN